MDDAPESASTSTGAMVIRAWSEPAAVQGFRARLTIMTSDGTQESTVAADGEQVVETVLQWLATFAPAPPSAPDRPTDSIG